MISTLLIEILACSFVVALSNSIPQTPLPSKSNPNTDFPLPRMNSIPNLMPNEKIQCVADQTTRCLTNYTTTCTYMPSQNTTACTLTKSYQAKVNSKSKGISNTVNKTRSPEYYYVGNVSMYSAQNIIESMCVTNKNQTLTCTTKTMNCTNIYSPNYKCVSAITNYLQLGEKATQKIMAQKKKCTQATTEANNALLNKDMACRQLDQASDSTEYRKLVKACKSAMDKWYLMGEKKADACNNKQ